MMKRNVTSTLGAGLRVKDILTLHIDAELKTAIGEAADEAGLPMNEYAARVFAKHLRRPELAKIPRKSYGRPRKELETA
jgi:hypothetical protein